MTDPKLDPGSFRDPGGQVFVRDGRVFRTVNAPAAEDFDHVEASGLMDGLVGDGLVVESRKVSDDVLGIESPGLRHVLEHPRLPFISYPYEWPFHALKEAALLHLDIQLRALDHDVALSDATAYNIQFRGPNPIFIDRLSFIRYSDGDIWAGHKQFIEQFLNPLLLRSLFGVPHNDWYRGALEGISSADLKRLLRWRHRFSWNILCHVILQSAFQSSVTRADTKELSKNISRAGLPRAAYRNMLSKLRGWIAGLEPQKSGKTTWQDYARTHSYSSGETERKLEFVGKFARDVRPAMAWDLGCNTGNFSKAMLENGAGYVVGFDFDQGAIEALFMRAREEKLNLLPLLLDAANPSPGQGWNESERMSLSRRATADAVVALAFIHHLAIGKNIPLDRLVDWITGFAPDGVIEFVPKSDPMVGELLALRKDIFPNYTEEKFREALTANNEIVEELEVTDRGRKLFRYRRKERSGSPS